LERAIRRRGIALLITIAFVLVIMAIIGMMLGTVQSSQKSVSQKKVLIQSDILLSNMLGILKSASGDINDSVMLDIFLSMPFVFDNSSHGISVDIAFRSNARVVNVNWLVLDKNSTNKRDPFEPEPLNQYIEEYLERILTVYNVSDTILLLSMIADTIDEDTDERISGSEIVRDNLDFMQSKIYNMHHFEQILYAYKQKTLDFSVDKIPWQSLISFDNDKIDFNYINPAVLQFVLEGLDAESIRLLTTHKDSVFTTIDDLPFSTEDKEKLKKMKIVFFDPNLRTTMRIQSTGAALQVALNYNLKTKRVSRVEITR